MEHLQGHINHICTQYQFIYEQYKSPAGVPLRATRGHST